MGRILSLIFFLFFTTFNYALASYEVIKTLSVESPTKKLITDQTTNSIFSISEILTNSSPSRKHIIFSNQTDSVTGSFKTLTPGEGVVDRISNKLYLANGNKIFVINTVNNNQLEATITLDHSVGSLQVGIVGFGRQRKIFASLVDSSSSGLLTNKGIAVIDPETNQVLKILNFNSDPVTTKYINKLIEPANDNVEVVYIASPDSNILHVVNYLTYDLIADIELPLLEGEIISGIASASNILPALTYLITNKSRLITIAGTNNTVNRIDTLNYYPLNIEVLSTEVTRDRTQHCKYITSFDKLYVDCYDGKKTVDLPSGSYNHITLAGNGKIYVGNGNSISVIDMGPNALVNPSSTSSTSSTPTPTPTPSPDGIIIVPSPPPPPPVEPLPTPPEAPSPGEPPPPPEPPTDTSTPSEPSSCDLTSGELVEQATDLLIDLIDSMKRLSRQIAVSRTNARRVIRFARRILREIDSQRQDCTEDVLSLLDRIDEQIFELDELNHGGIDDELGSGIQDTFDELSDILEEDCNRNGIIDVCER